MSSLLGAFDWIEGSTLDFPKEVDIKNLLNGDRLIICDIRRANGDLVIWWMDYELGISSTVSYSKIKWPADVVVRLTVAVNW